MGPRADHRAPSSTARSRGSGICRTPRHRAEARSAATKALSRAHAQETSRPFYPGFLHSIGTHLRSTVSASNQNSTLPWTTATTRPRSYPTPAREMTKRATSPQRCLRSCGSSSITLSFVCALLTRTLAQAAGPNILTGLREGTYVHEDLLRLTDALAARAGPA